MVNGVFDLLHAGHINFLRQAKEKGDVLIVAINSDKSVKTYKGKDKPIMPEKERAVLLASLFFIDYVTIFDESEALDIIRKIKPDVLVKGIRRDEKRLVEEIKLIDSLDSKITYVENEVTISTGQIINKIKGIHG